MQELSAKSSGFDLNLASPSNAMRMLNLETARACGVVPLICYTPEEQHPLEAPKDGNFRCDTVVARHGLCLKTDFRTTIHPPCGALSLVGLMGLLFCGRDLCSFKVRFAGGGFDVRLASRDS